MTTVDRHSDRALYHQLADVLRTEIKNGRYPRGTYMPAELEIATRHGVKRPTVRKAFAILRSEGLILTKRGERAMVRIEPMRESRYVSVGEYVTCRLPSQPERVALDLDEGVPVMEIHRVTGVTELVPGDRVNVYVNVYVEGVS
jgi:DNA-binding transcriptional regulator YhcF (GntR family)